MTTPWADVQQIAGILALFGAALLILIVDLFLKTDRNKTALAYLSLLGLVLALADILQRFGMERPLDLFSHALVIDHLALYSSTIILISAVVTILISSDTIQTVGINRAEYYSLLLISTAGMILLTMSNDLVTFFLSLEILSLALYILTGIMKGEPRSNEAAIKYFVVGAFATGILLYGMAFLYGATGTVYIDQMAVGMKNATLGIMGLGLFIIGLSFKVGAVPFHMWVPDVYEGAPTAVTGFMAVTVKAAGFTALLRLVLFGFPGHAAMWGEMLWVVAALTMIVGNVLAITQSSVKRMLAYSSIAHTGYALVAVVACAGFGSASASEPVRAALFYLFVYSFMTLGAFAVLVLARKRSEQDLEAYSDYAGLAWRRPWTAAAMTLFMVSLAGIPPTAGFFAKFSVFEAAIKNGYVGLTLVGILTTIVSLYYYLKVVVLMYMKDPEPADAWSSSEGEWSNVATAVLLTALGTLALGLYPGLVF